MSGDGVFRLLFLRHGETDLNLEQRMQGIPGVDLNETGRRQLAAAAEVLAGEGITDIVSSDLERARQSAAIVAGRLHLPFRLDPRLREQNLGTWEGESWPGLADVFGEAEVASFLTDADYAPPAGESKRSVLERVSACFEEMRAAGHGKTVLAVSHGGPLLAFVYRVLGIPMTVRNRFYGGNGSLTEFAFHHGAWHLVTLNEIRHLRVAGLAGTDP